MWLLVLDGTVWRQDVATRACTWMCAFWRVPASTNSHILRRAINFKIAPPTLVFLAWLTHQTQFRMLAARSEHRNQF